MAERSMLAAVIPARAARWEVEDVPTPRPGAGQVLVQVKASGLCHSDLHLTSGFMPTHFPCVPGHEPVGEISEIGDGVHSRAVGDRVGVPWAEVSCGRCQWCQRGTTQFCTAQQGAGVQTQGGHAQYVVAEATTTVLLPARVSYPDAAAMICAGYSAYSALRSAAPAPHETVAVLGIGGVGHLALQFAAATGRRTIAITSTPDKHTAARELGADAVVPDGVALRDIGGADVIVATGNSYRAVTESMTGLRPRGRVVVVGASAEPLVFPLAGLPWHWRLIGATQGPREDLVAALDLLADGVVRPRTVRFPLASVALACDRLAAGDIRFKAVIEP